MYRGEEHREISAGKNIKKGESVLLIPDSLILNTQQAQSSSIGAKILK